MYCRELPERGWQLLSAPSLEMRRGGYETSTEITEKSSAVWGSASCSRAQQSRSHRGICGDFAADGISLLPPQFMQREEREGGGGGIMYSCKCSFTSSALMLTTNPT